MTQVIFFTTPGLQTWTIPDDWSDDNLVECVGAGGSGGSVASPSSGALGGGGGAYSAGNVLGLVPGQVISIQVGASTAGVTTKFGIFNPPNPSVGGPDFTASPKPTYANTFFNGTNLANSSVSAEGGYGGQAGVLAFGFPTHGGRASEGIGAVKFGGGDGGAIPFNTVTVPLCGTGGGGAAGPHGPGLSAPASPGTTAEFGSNGAAADAGLGGAGGLGVGFAGFQEPVPFPRVATPGANGPTVWTSTLGATAGLGGGGGGAGYVLDNENITAGNGGQYGGGGGGSANYFKSQTSTSGSSGQGIIIVTFGPPTPPPPPAPVRGYIIERFDNRIWPTIEDVWCVDCAFELPQPTPDADLNVDFAAGAGAVSGFTSLVGGSGYSSATTAAIIDNNGLGPGTGAVVTLTIISGVITAINISTAGNFYTFPAIVFNDPANTGFGASADVLIDNSATFTASAGVFSNTDVGSAIRAGYGKAVITSFVSATEVIANVLMPLVKTNPDSPDTPAPLVVQRSGSWTLTAPITQFYLPALAGYTITGVADGEIITPRVIPSNGIASLDAPASAVIVGLAFTAQLQSTYLDGGDPTVQGQRKKVAEVTARIEASSAFQIGSNQPDGAAQNPIQLAPTWQNMVDAPTHAVPPFQGGATPLFTGDVRIPVQGGYQTKGQVAVQQTNPYPLQVLAFVPEGLEGDKPSQEAEKRPKK